MRQLQRDLRIGLLEDVTPYEREPGDCDAACAEVAVRVTARWPESWIDGVSFGRYLARRVDPTLGLGSALAELWVADLYLACACSRGLPAAHAALEREYLAELPHALRTIDAHDDFIAEVVQMLREKLLVAHGGVARIESYSGHGPLGGWLRVAAMRTALSLRRRQQPELAPQDELEAVLDLAPNAEVKLLAERLGTDLRAALSAAVAAQPARMRAVMRLYYADNHGVEDIGRVYSVHASTVSRWLAKARIDILAHTRAQLVALVHSESSLDSLLGHVASLEISFDSLLRSTP
jgi:RNA polymerase sigma-70 factor (ECF subfamily)